MGGCLHGDDPTQGAGVLGHAARIRVRFDLGQSLVRIHVQCPEWSDKHRRGDDCRSPYGCPQETGHANVSHAYYRSGGCEKRRNCERPGGGDQPQRHESQHSTQTRSEETRSIDPAGASVLQSDSQEDRQGAGTEGDRQAKVHAREPQPLAGVPRQLRSVEGQAIDEDRTRYEGKGCGDAAPPEQALGIRIG